LDFIRAAAVQAVCLGHAWSFFIAGNHMLYVQNIAVCVFFILSGFVITHALIRREQYGFGAYLIARTVRIFSALLPAMIVIGAIDSVLVARGLHTNPEYVTPIIWIKTLLLFNNYPGIYDWLLGGPSFGSGGPLWTLAIEFHIYIIT